MTMGLDVLKQIFASDEVHIAIGRVLSVVVSQDRSSIKCKIECWPERMDLWATMTWEKVSDGGGDYQIPEPDDMVLVAFAYGKRDHAYVLKSLSSSSDRVPTNAVGGDRVVKARSGRSVWITSDNKIYLSQGDTAPTEPLVLGGVLKALLSSMLTEISAMATTLKTHSHPSVGSMTESAAMQAHADAFDELKADPVDNNHINSDLAFTEKG